MKLLLLAGTGEARRLSEALQARGVDAVASLAGGTRTPPPLALPTRVGGFGGAEGFGAYLRAQGIGAVLDATHPFAIRMSQRTTEVCRAMSLPYAQVLRPGWTPSTGDDWHDVADAGEVARLVPAGACVFLATGPQDLASFAGLRGRLWCRRIDPPDRPFPFPGGDWIVGRPPFSVADEVALFRRLGVDWLVTKNAGGAGARSKLDAARELRIPVAMIRRPAQPEGVTRFGTEAEALDWVERLWSDA